jgi:hypothetical protein
VTQISHDAGQQREPARTVLAGEAETETQWRSGPAVASTHMLRCGRMLPQLGQCRQHAPLAFPMSASTGPGPDARLPYRRIVRSFLRALGSTVALVTIYYLLPLDHPSTWAAVTILVIGLALLIGLVAFQVRSIVRSRFPALRAIEALATSVPLFLLLFASAYAVLSTISVRNLASR